MKVLVANLGSTSFKYRLLDMSDERQLARGGVERIGSPSSRCFVEIGTSKVEMEQSVPNHGVAVDACIQQLTNPTSGCLRDASEISAIGFKAVHGGRVSGVQIIDESVLQAMDEMNSVAPAHNPPYMAAMRQLATMAAKIPLVAAFETDFHQTIPEAWKRYAIPDALAEQLPIRKWGFHGASHRFIGWRMSQLLSNSDARVISLHLGGSSSLCAMRGGRSVATTMGMSPQTGLPHNNRVGDLDPYALPLMMEKTGLSLKDLLKVLATEGGLLGLSGGLSGDVRDLEQAAEQGNAKARLALDVFIAEIRRQLGSMLVALGGADAIVFTGGIGENSITVRRAVCDGLHDLGIALCETKNQAGGNQAGEKERRIDDAARGKAQLWIVPTNEELIVARQTVEAIRKPQAQ
ncbi:MAG: acetate/propionate family kinase [Planctomycetes bacterium]|nr:acetate/propionate family kinase [Planctomycetota bacterium]